MKKQPNKGFEFEPRGRVFIPDYRKVGALLILIELYGQGFLGRGSFW